MCVCVFYYCRTYYKAVRVGGGGEWRTCAMRDDEPRPVWMSLSKVSSKRTPEKQYSERGAASKHCFPSYDLVPAPSGPKPNQSNASIPPHWSVPPCCQAGPHAAQHPAGDPPHGGGAPAARGAPSCATGLRRPHGSPCSPRSPAGHGPTGGCAYDAPGRRRRRHALRWVRLKLLRCVSLSPALVARSCSVRL